MQKQAENAPIYTLSKNTKTTYHKLNKKPINPINN
jgi:hypothetical protein